MSQYIQGGMMLTALILPTYLVWLLHLLIFIMFVVVLLDLYFIWIRCRQIRHKLSRRRKPEDGNCD